MKFAAVGGRPGTPLSWRLCAHFSRRCGNWTGIAYKNDSGSSL